MRDTLSFVVSLVGQAPDGTPIQRWVNGDALPVETEQEAVSFTVYASPSQRDRIAIQREAHDLVGGLRPYVDLTDGMNRTHQFLMNRIFAALWHEGRPKAEGAEAKKQEAQIQTAWFEDESPEMLGYHELREQHDRVQFMATWKTLLVSAVQPAENGKSVDATSRWKNIADWDRLGDVVFQALWATWIAAHEARDRGKA